MKLRVEKMNDTWVELDALVHDYYERTQAKEGMPPLRFNWPTYFMYEELGNTKLCTARHEKSGQLFGFVMYLISPHPHHIGVLYALCDTLAVGVYFRGQSIGRTVG